MRFFDSEYGSFDSWRPDMSHWGLAIALIVFESVLGLATSLFNVFPTLLSPSPVGYAVIESVSLLALFSVVLYLSNSREVILEEGLRLAVAISAVSVIPIVISMLASLYIQANAAILLGNLGFIVQVPYSFLSAISFYVVYNWFDKEAVMQGFAAVLAGLLSTFVIQSALLGSMDALIRRIIFQDVLGAIPMMVVAVTVFAAALSKLDEVSRIKKHYFVMALTVSFGVLAVIIDFGTAYAVYSVDAQIGELLVNSAADNVEYMTYIFGGLTVGLYEYVSSHKDMS